MRVIPPLTGSSPVITAAMLTSTSISEPAAGEAVYNAGTTYAVGDKVIVASLSSTVAISIASPAVVSWTNNGVPDGAPVVLTTTGALPTGLTAGQIYYAVNRASGTFQLAETVGGSPINTSGSQSGTHTATAEIHRRYESVVGSNTGNRPAIDDGTNWIDIGPTNRWAMFDTLRNTGSSGASPLTVTITPGQRIDSVGIVGAIADSIEIDLKVGGISVDGFPYSVSLSTRDTATWYEYFFGEFTYQTAYVFQNLPPYVNAVLYLTFTRAAGDVTVGGVIPGMSVYLGITLHDAENEGLNFSTIERDDFGTAILVPRRTLPKVNFVTRTKKANVPAVVALRGRLNAVPAFWYGIDDVTSGYFEPTQILGIYKRLTVTMDQPDDALVSGELEEV
jgi:hypothetical protein